MAIYRTIKGKRVKVSTRELKKEIMTANNWTEEQYRKQYDLFKNKLRAYESFRKEHGAAVTPQSPQELLYRQARSKKLHGAQYKPSLEMQRIQSFSAVSITKGRILATKKDSKYTKAREKTFAETTSKAFQGLIKAHPIAKKIDEEIKDPVKKEEALKALAAKIKATMKEREGDESEEAIKEQGEVLGSDETETDFDYSEWLD